MPFNKTFARHGYVLRVILRKKTEERLKTTCFRSKEVALAGNFSKWNSFEELMQNGFFRDDFLEGIDEVYREGVLELTDSIEIEMDDLVGWSSTVSRDGLDDCLESFSPNPRSQALRVKKEKKEIRAPKTKLITVVFEFKLEKNESVVVIHSIYPGEDIGSLFGDITEKTGQVFFDWSHPGA